VIDISFKSIGVYLNEKSILKRA